MMPALLIRSFARTAVVGLLFSLTACSKSQSPQKAMEDILKSFSGKWKVISLDRSGKLSDADTLKGTSITVEGDTFKFVEISGPNRGTAEVIVRDILSEEYILQVNPAISGDVDFIYAMGEQQGKPRLGLYELKGETLTICLASVGEARPGKIASGPGLTVFVLERQP